MKALSPVTLEFNGLRLEPMTRAHAADLALAAADGELWNLHVTSVPAPGEEAAYIDKALQDSARLPWVVRDIASGKVIGSTSFHDMVPAIGRVEIGYTWYGKSWQRSHVNTSCKLLLLGHAFDTLGCAVVGFRTDHLNHASQAAIVRLGAQRDGTLRHHALRRDGSVRDTVMFSILAGEWPAIKAGLQQKLQRYRGD
ncbi:RimJ/RimL family protein N-acetyltransferase [Actimicrobium sp. GrIS 1.19]|uniref:GNAT family N-acetyltransferase n=1 Tax=Actimicrobium sp. GrIS 1.19 TaxID=3071708 RepID=UPI002DFCEDB0|nr:RimJ/RimL family protein N-acetyltransferase [Actimicrobium sp. GrIS 1.19]